MTIAEFSLLRGHMKQLVSLSLRRTIPINKEAAVVFCSFPLLEHLDVSGNQCDVEAFQLVDQTCHRLTTLVCHDCMGLDDYTLMHIGRCAHCRPRLFRAPDLPLFPCG